MYAINDNIKYQTECRVVGERMMFMQIMTMATIMLHTHRVGRRKEGDIETTRFSFMVVWTVPTWIMMIIICHQNYWITWFLPPLGESSALIWLFGRRWWRCLLFHHAALFALASFCYCFQIIIFHADRIRTWRADSHHAIPECCLANRSWGKWYFMSGREGYSIFGCNHKEITADEEEEEEEDEWRAMFRMLWIMQSSNDQDLMAGKWNHQMIGPFLSVA